MGIGLALAGGGLKGVAHIGAIKALQELGVKIDFISGTSSGSLMAAMFVCGYNVTEMKDFINKYYKQISTLEKKPIVKSIGSYVIHKDISIEGLSNGQKIEDLVNMMASKNNIKNMNETIIPAAFVTCDTITMKECVLVSKEYDFKDENKEYIYNVPIGKAVRASMSFPGIYTTCNYGKYNFIDGGTKNNLPVQVLKDMGADKIISVSFELDGYKPTGKIFDVVIRALDIFSLDNVKKGREESNVSCIVRTEDTSLLEIKDTEAVINAGYNAVMEHKEEILKLI
jgi:NTE family protein